MYTLCLFCALLVAVQGTTWQCRNASAANYVLASYIKCDLDLRSQCGCGSWCGIGGPTITDDIIPKCTPRIDTPDAAPPVSQGGNPCPLQECPFAPFNLVRCPPGTSQYSYIGASCNRINGACVWQLPYCPPVYPIGNARCNTCTNKPTAPPSGEAFACTGWYDGVKTDYQCVHDGTGGCKWVWQPCPGTTSCPEGMEQFSSFDCSGINCNWKSPSCTDCPDFPSQCGTSLTTKQQPELCGGCNCRVFNSNNNSPVCLGQTLIMPYNATTAMGLQCKTGYQYQSTWPFCVPINPPSCATLTCGTDEICMEVWTRTGVYSKYVPTCAPKPRMTDHTTLPCSEVSCSNGFTCQTDQATKKWSCVRNAAVTCTAADCPNSKKYTCWDGSQVGSGCYFSQSGECEWGYVACPNFTVPATSPTGAVNCQVGPWTSWSCKAPCGQWTKQTRTRQITQNNGTNGVPCPALLEAGNDCQGTAATGCVNPPAVSSVASTFTSATVTSYSVSTGYTAIYSSTTGGNGVYATAAVIGTPSTAGPTVSTAGTGVISSVATGSASSAGSTGQTTVGSTGQTSAGSTGQTSAGSTSQTSAGSTSQTSAGSTSQTSAGSTSQTSAGSTSQTSVGSTSQTGPSTSPSTGPGPSPSNSGFMSPVWGLVLIGIAILLVL